MFYVCFEAIVPTLCLVVLCFCKKKIPKLSNKSPLQSIFKQCLYFVLCCMKHPWRNKKNIFPQSYLGFGWSFICICILYFGLKCRSRWSRSLIHFLIYKYVADYKLLGLTSWQCSSLALRTISGRIFELLTLVLRAAFWKPVYKEELKWQKSVDTFIWYLRYF